MPVKFDDPEDEALADAPRGGMPFVIGTGEKPVVHNHITVPTPDVRVDVQVPPGPRPVVNIEVPKAEVRVEVAAPPVTVQMHEHKVELIAWEELEFDVLYRPDGRIGRIKVKRVK
jgi:hypothetical protein